MRQFMFNGMRVIESPHIAPAPKMTLAPQGIGPGKVYVSDSVRVMMDQWMLERFGTYLPVFVMDTGAMAFPSKSGEKVVCMHPEHIKLLKLKS